MVPVWAYRSDMKRAKTAGLIGTHWCSTGKDWRNGIRWFRIWHVLRSIVPFWMRLARSVVKLAAALARLGRALTSESISLLRGDSTKRE